MLKKILLGIALVLCFCACKTKEGNSNSDTMQILRDTNHGKASDAILRYYAALNSHDTSKFADAIPYDVMPEKRRSQMIVGLVYQWRNRHVDIKIIYDSTTIDSAVVKYHVKITGELPFDTVRIDKLRFLGGCWVSRLLPPLAR